MKKHISKLILGNRKDNRPKTSSFYSKQFNNLKSIWNNDSYNDFGLERIIRLLLTLLGFIAPGSLIKFITGNNHLVARKVGVEIFAILKIILIITAFKLNLTTNISYLIIVIVLTADTMLYLLSRLFLSDLFNQSISYKRSLIMTFLNYIEVALCFALVYSYIDDINPDPTNKPIFLVNNKLPYLENGHLSDTETIYFSFITAATIGYGDVTPCDPYIMRIVLVQIVISLFFIVVFVSNIINRLGEVTYFNLNRSKDP